MLYCPEHGGVLTHTHYMLGIRAPGEHATQKAAAMAFFGVTGLKLEFKDAQ